MSEYPSHVEALVWATYAAYMNTLVGDPAPAVRDFGEWMRDIKVGTFVMETSTIYRRKTDDEHRQAIGIVTKTEDREVCRHEHDDPNLEHCDLCTGEEREDGTGYRWREHFVWLQTSDGTKHRWHNADFIRVPRNEREFREHRDDPWKNEAARLRAVREAEQKVWEREHADKIALLRYRIAGGPRG